MKVAIVGSRTFNDYEKFKEEISKIDIDVFPVILTGDAKGADKLARIFANKRGDDLIVFKPVNRYIENAYGLLGNNCYFARNKQIVDNCDFLIAFWDGKSGGTKMTINYAKQQNKQYKIIKV
jgi:hypothetical protein